MKHHLTATLLLALLLITTTLPALASPTGASPEDIALWQSQAPAPCGEFQKIITVLGDQSAPTIQRRLSASQRGPVIDNSPRFAVVVTITDGRTILRYLTGAELEGEFGGAMLWGTNTIYTGDILKRTSGGLTEYLVYGGPYALFAGDPTDFLSQPTTTLPDNIPVYAAQDYLDNRLQLGDIVQINNTLYQMLRDGDSLGAYALSNSYYFIHPSSY